MGNGSGYFSVDRGIWDHHLFKDEPEPFSKREAWLWLISHAEWRPTRQRIKGKTFELKRGQMLVSFRKLATLWRWSEGRVRRYFDALKFEAMIDTQADALATQITICNYDEYQATRRTDEHANGAPSDAVATQSHIQVVEPACEISTKELEEDKKEEIQKESFLSLNRSVAEATRPDEPKKQSELPVAEPAPHRAEVDAGMFVDLPEKPVVAKRRRAPPVSDALFQRFWEGYPKRGGSNPSTPAFKKFAAAVKSGVDPEMMIAAAARYRLSMRAQRKEGTQYVVQAKRWLNEQWWKEYSNDAPEIFDSREIKNGHNGSQAFGRNNQNGGFVFHSNGQPPNPSQILNAALARVREDKARKMASGVECEADGGGDLGGLEDVVRPLRECETPRPGSFLEGSCDYPSKIPT